MPEEDPAGSEFGVMQRLRQVSAVLYALMLVTGGWTYVAWLVEKDFSAALETSHRRGLQFAKGLALQVEAMASDGLGAATVGAALMGSELTEAEAVAVLGGGLTGGEYVRSLFVIDESGMRLAQRPGEDFGAGTRTLQSALGGTSATDWAGPMVDGPSGRAFPVARRALIRGRDVWVGAWLGSRDLEEIYADFEQPHSYMALTTLDGVILGLFPPQGPERINSAIGNSTMRAQLRNLPVHGTTFMEGTKGDSDRVFLYGAYRVAGLPLLAVTSRTRDDALGAWRARRGKTVLFAALTTVVVFGFAVMLQLAFNRSLRNAQALAQARRSELDAKESLANGLMLTQDAERRRLAGELHDGIGQTLSLLRNQVLLLQRTALPEQAREKAHTLLELSSEAIEDLRDVARALRPMHLKEQGVTGALQAMLKRLRTSSELELRSKVEVVDDVITGDDATHLYRIAQEAVSNVIKHAEAVHLSIEMIRDISFVELRIRDDGKGMPPAGSEAAGIGLLSIRERCRMLGATLAIEPNQPSGTSVTVRIPIRPTEAATA
ncbi:MAG: histidine kinase [Steroidobacteraceae bacterium]